MENTALNQECDFHDRIAKIVSEALLAGGRYRVRRVSNALALLRELKTQNALPIKFEDQFNALETVWRSMQKAGTAHPQPKLFDRQTLALLVKRPGNLAGTQECSG